MGFVVDYLRQHRYLSTVHARKLDTELGKSVALSMSDDGTGLVVDYLRQHRYLSTVHARKLATALGKSVALSRG